MSSTTQNVRKIRYSQYDHAASKKTAQLEEGLKFDNICLLMQR